MIDFADLDQEPVIGKAEAPQKTFPCTVCNGTGKYRGVRVYQDKSHCFACKGEGCFKTDPRKLAARRAKAKLNKAAKLAKAIDQFDKANPGIHEFLKDASRWSEFASSILGNLEGKGGLSERQLDAAKSMKAKSEAREKERAEARAKESVSVDLSPIKALFETAKESGKARPVFRAEGLALSLAPESGRNAGAIYVKKDGEYAGKLVGDKFLPAFGAEKGIGEALLEIAKNPKESAIRYGRLTGACSCCGRELTNKASIELGIGPICAEAWGF
ncbi:DUF6011 domain-containing protein [Roseibium aggregatum]|uniref:Uncharacterized protein n=1 Tax=Roseibium aggregatum TaxID=187304 RepID=A0A0M6Y6F0_9HYPH|nr:DUF6011 domain-containing protein [Roseibium aggregatum]CTQ45672.1 hypothetical protein LAL4801_04127 [Roseibium aggregatum]